MMPTMGRIVLYCFSHRADVDENGEVVLETRVRPAVVISDPDPDGRVLLYPLLSCLDDPILEHWFGSKEGPSSVPVAPHRAELGVVEMCQPQPGTWFWPPNDQLRKEQR